METGKDASRVSAAATRLFRVDTPADIASAAIVAGTLPAGRDILVFSTDKAGGDSAQFADRMRAAAVFHSWSDVIDISGLPLRAHMFSARPAKMLRRVRDTVQSIRMLRRMLAPAFGLDPGHPDLDRRLAGRVDELYLTCLSHADVQALYSLFPSARKIFSPHGFDSLNSSEVHNYSRFCSASGAAHESWRDAVVDGVKSLLFGCDALLPRRMCIDEAYSFNRAAPWASIQHDLSRCLSRSTMSGFFSRLPGEVRGYFEGLARQCEDDTTLVLLAPYDSEIPSMNQRELEADVEMARKLVHAVGSSVLIVKPHPRNSEQHVRVAVERLALGLPATRLVVVRRFHEYPMEIVFAPFSIQACGALGSCSLRTLRKIYGTTSYCAERSVLQLYAAHPRLLESYKIWAADNRQDYVAI